VSETLPSREPEDPRNDSMHGEAYGFVVTPEHLLQANKNTNRMIVGSEDLTQDLTINEVQSLCKRALQLAVKIRDLKPQGSTSQGRESCQEREVKGTIEKLRCSIESGTHQHCR
jgi:hypothetical protein